MHSSRKKTKKKQKMEGKNPFCLISFSFSFTIAFAGRTFHMAVHLCNEFILMFGRFTASVLGSTIYVLTLIYSKWMFYFFVSLLAAVSTQFFFLAAFFWLNTMCFNIWWTFRWVIFVFFRLLLFRNHKYDTHSWHSFVRIHVKEMWTWWWPVVCALKYIYHSPDKF